jgi:galacturan 1,4-alpha-galacturonidase
MIDSTKAVGIKLYEGGDDHGTATVSNMTWQNIEVDNCGYAAQVQSCYGSSSDEDCGANPSAAQLTEINFINFSGTT